MTCRSPTSILACSAPKSPTRLDNGNWSSDYLRSKVPSYVRDKPGPSKVLCSMILSPEDSDKPSVHTHFIANEVCLLYASEGSGRSPT